MRAAVRFLPLALVALVLGTFAPARGEDVTGDDDLVAGWGQTPETTVWQNDGTGRFTDITASSVFPGHGDREVRSVLPQSVAVARALAQK